MAAFFMPPNPYQSRQDVCFARFGEQNRLKRQTLSLFTPSTPCLRRGFSIPNQHIEVA